ncbi:MAG: diguanylate cyclase [Mycobacterium sp.]
MTTFVVSLTVMMGLLVAVRQVVAMRAQHLLTQRLYWAQRGLAYQVHHDALTGLPNRLLFGQRLDEAIRDGRFVLIFVDLDDFKEVNDRFGHAAGDDLLRAVGERLTRCITAADTLARIGSDEFAILIEGEADEPEIVADRLRVALRDPFAVHGSSLRVRASTGLVRSDADGLDQTSDDLLRRADISMYAGKRLGKDTAVIYQPSTGLQDDFPTALRRARGGVPDGFRLAYQPVVRLPGRTPVAVEALARWTAPSGIDIAPQTFVAAAEAAGALPGSPWVMV